MEIYRDASQPVEARARDLILKMTLDEKIAQLGAVWSFEVLEDGRFSPRKAGALVKDGIGHTCRPGVGTALPPEGIADFANGVQHFLVTKTRLGIPAIIQAWLPGEEAGNAIADVLFGDCNPGGKLPISIPERVGQVPVYYGHKPSGARSQVWGDYVETGSGPAFEFGYGLSYTSFEFSNLRIEPAQIRGHTRISVQVDVRNTGNRPGEEVVQLYINDIFASVTRPVKELKGFRRIALEPGETGTVQFELPVETLGFYDQDMRFTVEPGAFKVMVGRSSQDIVLEGVFEILAELA